MQYGRWKERRVGHDKTRQELHKASKLEQIQQSKVLLEEGVLLPAGLKFSTLCFATIAPFYPARPQLVLPSDCRITQPWDQICAEHEETPKNLNLQVSRCISDRVKPSPVTTTCLFPVT